ncbi:ependymin-2-like [Clinocottus analis]|uniref:ependymin-2-like n=1 Tax=Clinocottus analis TaxID=304258 RepID=UPI0035BF5F4F
MILFGVLTCFLAGCLAQRPHPCSSPPLLSGGLTVDTQNEKLTMYGRYLYDALGQRIRVMELGSFENTTFTNDALLLYREGVMYEINDHDRTCVKKPLKVDFQPIAIPKDASLLAQVVLGSSSEPGQGLLVNTWVGDLPDKTGKVISTVTEFGCIPVGNLYHTDKFGWVLMNYFDNVLGIPDPERLNPPVFCGGAEMKVEDETDFLSLFMNKP